MTASSPQEAGAPQITDEMIDAALDELGWPKNVAEVAAIASTDPDPEPPEFWVSQYRDAGRAVVAAVYPLVAAVRNPGDRMYLSAYFEVQKILDAALGGAEGDGAGGGIAAEVQLLADQRDEARAALASREAEVRRKVADQLHGQAARCSVRQQAYTPPNPMYDLLAEHAGIYNAAALIAADGSEPDRCQSCEHSIKDWHRAEGCWFAVPIARPDGNIVCPCSVVGAS